MEHAACQDLLLDLVYGELEPLRAAEVELHLAACAECQAARARIDSTRALFAPITAPAFVESPGENFDGPILAAARGTAMAAARRDSRPLFADPDETASAQAAREHSRAEAAARSVASAAAPVPSAASPAPPSMPARVASLDAAREKRRPLWRQVAIIGSVAAAAALAVVVSTGRDAEKAMQPGRQAVLEGAPVAIDAKKPAAAPSSEVAGNQLAEKEQLAGQNRPAEQKPLAEKNADQPASIDRALAEAPKAPPPAPVAEDARKDSTKQAAPMTVVRSKAKEEPPATSLSLAQNSLGGAGAGAASGSAGVGEIGLHANERRAHVSNGYAAPPPAPAKPEQAAPDRGEVAAAREAKAAEPEVSSSRSEAAAASNSAPRNSPAGDARSSETDEVASMPRDAAPPTVAAAPGPFAPPPPAKKTLAPGVNAMRAASPPAMQRAAPSSASSMNAGVQGPTAGTQAQAAASASPPPPALDSIAKAGAGPSTSARDVDQAKVSLAPRTPSASDPVALENQAADALARGSLAEAARWFHLAAAARKEAAPEAAARDLQQAVFCYAALENFPAARAARDEIARLSPAQPDALSQADEEISRSNSLAAKRSAATPAATAAPRANKAADDSASPAADDKSK